MTAEEDPGVPVRRFWDDVWSRGDVDALNDILASGMRENGEELDVAEFKKGVTAWRELFAGFTVTIDELLTIGDRVVTRVTHRGRHAKQWGPIPPSGADTESLGIDIFRVRDGRITELWHAVDHLPLVRQIGGRVTHDPPPD